MDERVDVTGVLRVGEVARKVESLVPAASVGSFMAARATLLEALEDFLFGDSFGGKSRLQPRGCFLERGAVCFRALTPLRNVVADRIPWRVIATGTSLSRR